MKSKFFPVTSSATLARLKVLCDEYALYDVGSTDVFFMYGYQTLSSGAKDTYRILKSLQNIQKKQVPSDIESTDNNYEVIVSLQYLALIFNTSEETQAQRIRQLAEHKLISIHRRAYHITSYRIYVPTPDSTFVYTLARLAQRRRLSELAYKLQISKKPADKITYLEKIKNLVALGVKHYSVNLPKLEASILQDETLKDCSIQ